MFPKAEAGTAIVTGPGSAVGERKEFAQTSAEILQIARARFAFIILVGLIVGAIAGAIAWAMPVTYSSSAEILLDERHSKVADLSTVVAEPPSDPAWIQDQIRVLTSRNLAASVISRLGLSEDPELRGGGSAKDRIIDSFLAHLNAEALGLSSTIAVTFSSHDAQLAAAVANAVAEVYIDHERDANSEAARRAQEWLEQRVRVLAAESEKADTAVEAYKRAHGLSDAADGTPLIEQEMAGEQQQLVLARAGLAEKEATRTRLRALAQAGSAADFAVVAASPTIVQLRQQETEVMRQEADLNTRYGPKNPKLIAIASERDDVERKIDAEIQRIEGAVDSDVAVAHAQIASLESSLQADERLAESENAQRVALSALESDAKSTRTAYEAFVSRLREVQGQDAIELPDASIISRAPVPAEPSSPRRLVVVVAAVPAGLLLGLLLALFGDKGVKSVTPDPRREPLPAPVLARIPELGNTGPGSRQLASGLAREPNSEFARALARIEVALDALPSTGGKIVGVTAANGGEASAMLALGIARAAAARGRRTLLVEADMASNVGALLDLDPRHPGFADVLAGAATPASCVLHDPLSTLLVLPKGSAAPARTGTQRLRDFTGFLRRSCDLVVIGMPPVGQLAFAELPEMDAAILLLTSISATPAGTESIRHWVATLPSRNKAIVIGG